MDRVDWRAAFRHKKLANTFRITLDRYGYPLMFIEGTVNRHELSTKETYFSKYTNYMRYVHGYNYLFFQTGPDEEIPLVPPVISGGCEVSFRASYLQGKTFLLWCICGCWIGFAIKDS